VVDAAFKRAYTLTTDSLTEDAFKNIISETLFPIRCGHTSVRHSVQWNRYFADRRPAGFPLGLKITNDSTLILTVNLNRNDSVLKRGMQIQSINGLTAKQIIDTLFPLVPIDGNSKNFSYQNISNNFQNFYNSRFPSSKTFQISYRNYEGIEKEINVPVLKQGRDTSRRPNNPPGITTPPPAISKRQRKVEASRSFSIDSSKQFATLRINTFSRYLNRGFINKSFARLNRKNIPALIIDVRNNGGGLIKSSLLLTKHLKQQPFYFTDSIVSTHKHMRSKIKINKKFITNLGMFFLTKKKKDSLYQFAFFKKEYQQKKKYYKGNVFILTGGYSFSATSMFLSNVKSQSNITLIGEETGGGYYGNNGVFIPEMVLPHTKLRVRLPLYRIVNNKNFPHNGSGVMPDVEIKASAESIRFNKDPKMEKAVEMILQKTN
jgi:hypothetical protein